MSEDGDSVMPLNGACNATTGAISTAHPLGGAPPATGTCHADTGAASARTT